MDPIEEQQELMRIWVSALRLSRKNPRQAALLLCGLGARAFIGTERGDPKEIVDLTYRIQRDCEVDR
jgi:intein/homing endonuclease